MTTPHRVARPPSLPPSLPPSFPPSFPSRVSPSNAGGSRSPSSSSSSSSPSEEDGEEEEEGVWEVREEEEEGTEGGVRRPRVGPPDPPWDFLLLLLTFFVPLIPFRSPDAFLTFLSRTPPARPPLAVPPDTAF